MQDEYELGWVQRNRSKKSCMRSAGSLVRELAEQLYTSNVAPAIEVAAHLTRVVDEEFCRHCRVADVRGGRLLIHVGRAELVYPMRLWWEDTLREALSAVSTGCRVNRVVFAFGTAGVSVG